MAALIVSLCPHCGSLTGDLTEITRMKSEMSKRQQRLLETILVTEPEGISRPDLAVRLYGPVVGKSKSGFYRLGNDISELRRKIDRFGYFIPPLGRERRNYRVLPLEQSA